MGFFSRKSSGPTPNRPSGWNASTVFPPGRVFECDDPVERDEARGIVFSVSAGPQVARDGEVILGRWVAGVANACQVVAQIPEDPEAQPTIVASGVANLLLSDTTLYIGFGGPGACESQSKVITGFGLVDLYPRAFCCAWPLNEIDRIERAGRRLTLHHDSPAAAFLADDVSAADEEWRHSVRGKLDEFHTAVTAAMAGAR